MSENEPPKNDLNSLFVGAGLGIAATLAYTSWSHEKGRRSRAEREQPELTEAVLDVLHAVFESARLTLDGADEAAYRRRIAGFLRRRHELTVEQEPRVDGRVPDILVEGVVAIEVKLSPRKTEVDRAVGQCVDYAQFWPTLLVVVDTTPSMAAEFERRLTALGCDRVFLIPFLRADDD